MADTVLADTGTDEGFLLALLNSTPVIDGVPADDLADPVRARAWLAAVGGRGTEAELRHVLRVRQALQAVVRGQRPAAVLAPELDGRDLRPGHRRRPDRLDPQRRPGPRAGRPRHLDLGRAGQAEPGTAAPVRQRRMPPVPHRSQQGQRRPVVLDGRLRQQDEGPPSLPAFTRLAPHRGLSDVMVAVHPHTESHPRPDEAASHDPEDFSLAQRCADGASRPRARARSTASARLCPPSLAYRLRMWVLTVLSRTALRRRQVGRRVAQHR